MKRIQLFEFEDLSWFPKTIRRSMTNLIALLHKMTGTREVIADLLIPIVRERQFNRIVDLGSGSGGIMPDVVDSINKEIDREKIQLILTDLYPNTDQISKWNNKKNSHISYHKEAVDATKLDLAPRGLKTMINCFHHMPPTQAKKILKTASLKKEPLLIYEMGENNIPLLIWWLLLPVSLFILMLMVLFMTPFVKPLTWQQLFFTYIIPIIPICYAWDGQASLPRMYTMADLESMLNDVNSPQYDWSMGRAYKRNKKKLGTFLIGLPKN